MLYLGRMDVRRKVSPSGMVRLPLLTSEYVWHVAPEAGQTNALSLSVRLQCIGGAWNPEQRFERRLVFRIHLHPIRSEQQVELKPSPLL